MGSRGSVIPLFNEFKKNNKKFLPITDKNMTRFFITLDQGVDFVMECLHQMTGGEMFVPKIPSVKIVDLAKAIAPQLKHKIIGIRPGEKIHELMCPNESVQNTLEFKDKFIIFPSPSIFDNKIRFSKKKYGGKGIKVSKNFEYSSDKNSNFLSVNEIKNLLLKLANDPV